MSERRRIQNLELRLARECGRIVRVLAAAYLRATASLLVAAPLLVAAFVKMPPLRVARHTPSRRFHRRFHKRRYGRTQIKFQPLALRGFSLIEVLVATAILVILVLVMSTIFHQSAISWDSGERKAEGNMTARAILGFMSRELTEAVTDPSVFVGDTGISNNVDTITFVTLRGTNSATHRIARKVKYEFQDYPIETIKRYEWIREKGENLDYGEGWVSPYPQGVDLGDRITRLKFYTSDGLDHTETLPSGVRVEMAVRRSDDVSGVGAWSYGPDGLHNAGTPFDPVNKDDISSK